MNDDEQLGRLYRTAISRLPGGQPDAGAARAAAGSRRGSRRRATVISAVVVAAVATVLVVVAPWSGQVATRAVPAGDPGAGMCPALRPGTSNASADYANLLVWGGRTYIDNASGAERRKPKKLGPQVTSITCSIAELTEPSGNLVADPPWPDGTATFLARGTPVFAVRGTSPRCALGVRETRKLKSATADGITLFIAIKGPSWEPLC